MLRKNSGFTTVAILTLALGIGANSTIFSFADLIMRRPVALPDLSRLVAVSEIVTATEEKGISPANYLDLKAAPHGLESLAAYQYWSAVLAADARERIGCSGRRGPGGVLSTGEKGVAN